MTSIAKSTAFVATFALSMTVAIAEVHATPEDCPTFTMVSVRDEQVALPADTAAQVTMLQQYGTRYARVIELILEEKAKPEWTFLEDCSAESTDVLAMTE